MNQLKRSHRLVCSPRSSKQRKPVATAYVASVRNYDEAVAIETKQDSEDRIGPWLELLEREVEPHNSWIQQRAALALAGSGVRAADGPLRRYGGIASVSGSWRATRWLELPRVLSLPFPERLSSIWTMFPFADSALALARPAASEMRTVFDIALGSIRREERDAMPIGSSCLLACASMAKELGVALPALETCWWLEQEEWGTAKAPTSAADGRAIAIAPSAAHPALVRDQLTTALNRHALHENPLDIGDTPIQNLSPLRNLGSGWALLADVDHLQQVNGTSGFAQGDALLCQLVDRFQRAFGDCVVRYAGEQFLVLWNGDGDGGMDVAEEMRALVAAEPFLASPADEAIHVTISVGAARFDDLGQGIEKALAALAEAKSAGRNCVRG